IISANQPLQRVVHEKAQLAALLDFGKVVQSIVCILSLIIQSTGIFVNFSQPSQRIRYTLPRFACRIGDGHGVAIVTRAKHRVIRSGDSNDAAQRIKLLGSPTWSFTLRFTLPPVWIGVLVWTTKRIVLSFRDDIVTATFVLSVHDRTT